MKKKQQKKNNETLKEENNQSTHCTKNEVIYERFLQLK